MAAFFNKIKELLFSRNGNNAIQNRKGRKQNEKIFNGNGVGNRIKSAPKLDLFTHQTERRGTDPPFEMRQILPVRNGSGDHVVKQQTK